MTSVPSWRSDGLSADADGLSADALPKVAVLFRGKRGGRIRNNTLATFEKPEWMEIQVQENGSYRSEDMVDFLEWALPDATVPEESLIVILDWYAGHRTKEVEECIKRKGHVLLFHGGGTTPFTQINDTHLHARVQALMEQIENRWALAELTEANAVGKRKTPTPKRSDICAWVKTMWALVDHDKVAAKCYMQTGPAMAMDGPVQRGDVFEDLLTVLDRIDPPTNPEEVGVNLRDKAKTFVLEGFDDGSGNGHWRTWSDAYKLIEEHDDEDDPAVEGLEAFGYETRGHGDEDDVDEEGEDDVTETGESGDDDDDGNPPEEQALSRQGQAEGEDPVEYTPSYERQEGDGGEAMEVPAPMEGAAPLRQGLHKIAEPTATEVGAANRVLQLHAMKTHDDSFLRRLRQKGNTQKREEREGATAVCEVLRQREAEEREKNRKRRKDASDADRLAADASANAAAIRDRAAKESWDARNRCLKQVSDNHRQEVEMRRSAAEAKIKQRWLQTEYPVVLAVTIIEDFDKMSGSSKANFQKAIRQAVREKLFERRLDIPELWVADSSLTLPWTQMKMPHGRLHTVRCGLKFQQVVDQYAPLGSLVRDPVDCLLRLFQRFMPYATKIFIGHSSAMQLIAANEYVFEKAFVYGLVALSKWLGADRWPEGLYGSWPPPAPAHLRESGALAPPTFLEVETDEPRDRIGAPAASSTG